MSNMYAIKDTTLTAIGDVIRNKQGIELEEHNLSWDYQSSNSRVIIPISKTPKHKVIVDDVNITSSAGGDMILSIHDGTTGDTVLLFSELFNINNPLLLPIEVIANRQAIKINGAASRENSFTARVRIIPLDENGNEYKYTPLEMAKAIDDLSTMPEEAFSVTGNCQYRFAYNGFNWLIDKYGDKIKTDKITDASYMFYHSTELTDIPFELNFSSSSNIKLSNMFISCSKLTSPPKLNSVKVDSMDRMFQDCRFLREIPEDYWDNIDFSYINNATSAYSANTNGIFNNCPSLRKLPMKLLKNGNPNAAYSNTIFSGLAQYGHVLDEIVDLPNPHYNATYSGTGYSSPFNNMVYQTYRLKEFTFAPMATNPKWANQVLDFTTVGYAPSRSYIIDYNSGITADKEVKNDATYQALKNDPDWFTIKIEYSRYNHDSAVNTINSLPDTTATGTNTIKFKGASGSLTDGGAINTLTEEEIAVAAAKGWTVSFV